MKKLMVYLDDDCHEDLRALAFKKRTTMAALVRKAIEKTYDEDLDVLEAERELERFTQDPSTAISLEEYLEKRRHAVRR